MNRLTQKDKQGNWCLRGVKWEKIHTGQMITTEVCDKLYGALWKLMEYEDTGLTPEEIMDGRMLTGWIPVEERTPEDGTEVLVTVYSPDGAFASTDICSKGEWQDYNGVIAWMPMPETYRPQSLKPAGEYADNDTLMPAT